MGQNWHGFYKAGQSPASSTYNTSGEGIPFFQGKSDFGNMYPKTRFWCSSPKKMAQKDDLLLSVRAPVGSTNISKEQCCIGRGLAAIRPINKNMNISFFIYFFRHIENHLEGLGTGTTFKAISGKQIRELIIPLPPLPEQKRIVSKLESIFSQIDACKEKLDRVKVLLKQNKQSVLKSSFEGDLVPQDPNDEPAEILLKKIHRDSKHEEPVFDKENIPKGWIRIKLKEIIVPSKQKFEPTKENNQPFVGLEHIESGSRKIIGKGCSVKTKSTKSIFNNGDILYGKLRPYLNKVAVADFDGVCSTDILVFSQKDNLNNEYVALFLSTNEFVWFCNRNMSGVQHPRIKFEKLSEYKIPLPPLNEQKRIVSKLESIFGRIDAIEKQVDDSLIKLNQLKKSVLKKAFEGKLVEQDPNDEPASILLEKIRQEKLSKNKK